MCPAIHIYPGKEAAKDQDNFNFLLKFVFISDKGRMNLGDVNLLNNTSRSCIYRFLSCMYGFQENLIVYV